MQMKSILIIETPKDCGDCPCLHDELWMCQADTEHREAEYSGRPSWCPLKLLPRRMPMRDEAEFYLGYMNGKTKYLGFNEGYNACLEDITGETE